MTSRSALILLSVLAAGTLVVWSTKRGERRTAAPAEAPAEAPPAATEASSSARPPWFDAEHYVTVETDAGPVAVTMDQLARLPQDALRAAASEARSAGLAATPDVPWRFHRSDACGWHLVDGQDAVLVLPEGVLRREAPTRSDRSAQRDAITAAAERVADLMDAHLSSGMRRAFRVFLGRLGEADDLTKSTEVRPAYARIIVADGWLDTVASELDPAARDMLLDALAEAMTFEVTEAWVGKDMRLRHVANAWGRTATHFLGTQDSTLVLQPVMPMLAPKRCEALATCRLVLEFPVGADPVGDAGAMSRVERAELVHGHDRLAWWSKTEGLGSNVAKWRAVFPRQKGRSVTNGFPPHVAIAGLDTSLYGVAVPGELLRPVRGGSHAEAERFLADAVRLLPDAAHLDLLQQYFMMYVLDSPDPSVPLAIGSAEAHADVHQTVYQTLATVAGGVCRGDCDDFAGLVSDLARRQGKLAHIFRVPGHLAAAWAEERADGWHVFIVQTGPALEFVRKSLPAALRRAYAYFDGIAPIDVDALAISIRFDDESIRSRYQLSWRIYADREFADTMIGIQKDWHDSTLLQGLEKARRLLASFDSDPGTCKEVGELCEQTGQFEEAARLYAKAGEQAPDEERRLHRDLDRLGALVKGEMQEEAIALGTEIVETRLPRIAPRLGFRAFKAESDVAVWIARAGAPELAARWLDEATRRPTAKEKPSLVDLVEADAKDEAWGSRWRRKMLRRVLREHASACVAVLRRLDAETRASDEYAQALDAHVEAWAQRAAFVELETPAQCLSRWSLLGRWLELRSDGDFLARLEDVAPPASPAKVDHAALARKPDSELALAWVRASPYTATTRLWRLVDEREHRPDPSRVRRLARLLEDGVDQSRRLGFEILRTNRTVHEARMSVALLTEDIVSLRALFQEVGALGSSRVAVRTASALGRVAPHLDVAFWKQAVACWVEEVGHKPLYFKVAWSAVRAGAPVHGLLVADVAAAKFQLDEAFVQEAARMHELLEGAADD